MLIKEKFKAEEIIKITHSSFLAKLLKTVLPYYYHGLTKIIVTDKRVYKKHYKGPRRYRYVIGCKISGLVNNEEITKEVIIGASSDDSKKVAYYNLKDLREHGFNKGHLQVTAPIAYIPELKAIIYEAAEGQALYNYLEQSPPFNQLLNPLELSANWLQKLHSLDYDILSNASNENYNFETVINYLSRYIKQFEKFSSSQGQKIELAINKLVKWNDKFKKLYHPRLVYGDYHPENIIIKSLRSRKLVMIDLTDLSVGDRYRDVGTFLQQFDFMSQRFLPRNEINKLKKHFVKSYFHKDFNKLKAQDLQRINLYQALVALRSSVWLFNFKGARTVSLELLNDSKLLLEKVERAEISINLR